MNTAEETVNNVFDVVELDNKLYNRKTFLTLSFNLQRLRQWFGDRPANSVSTANVEDYKDSRLKAGAKPVDLPVEQPAKFELMINMQPAKVVALTILPIVLMRASIALSCPPTLNAPLHAAAR